MEYRESGIAREPEANRSLEKLLGGVNIATILSEDELKKIGEECLSRFEADIHSRAAWKENYDDIIKLSKLEHEPKNEPWPGASSVKLPIITEALIQYQARAYPLVVQGKSVCKGKVIGHDPNGIKDKAARRMGMFQSHQLIDQMKYWEPETRKLLMIQPMVGDAARKTYWNPQRERPESRLVPINDVIFNNNALSYDSLPISHTYSIPPRKLIERTLAGIFRDDIDYGIAVSFDMPHNVKGSGAPDVSADKYTPHQMIEQHTYLDLDGDGYPEPYIVTIHYDTRKVVRIEARYDESDITYNGNKVQRIKEIEHWTFFPFWPSLDGLLGMGIGTLLHPLNDVVNAITNQMIDSGKLMNQPPGFISSSMKMKKGMRGYKPGELLSADSLTGNLRDGIFMVPMAGPSNVLFILLELMVSMSKGITSFSDLLAGNSPSGNQPASTTLSLIEQGLKVFGGNMKGLNHSLKLEFEKLRNMNKRYLPGTKGYESMGAEEVEAIQGGQGEGEGMPSVDADYAVEDIDIMPVADQSEIDSSVKIMKAEALFQFGVNRPGINQMELNKRYLSALNIEDKEELLEEIPEPPQPPDPSEDPAMMVEAARIELEKRKIEIESINSTTERMLSEAKAAELEASVLQTEAKARLLAAQTRKVEAETQTIGKEDRSNQLKQMADGLVKGK